MTHATTHNLCCVRRNKAHHTLSLNFFAVYRVCRGNTVTNLPAFLVGHFGKIRRVSGRFVCPVGRDCVSRYTYYYTQIFKRYGWILRNVGGNGH